LSTKSYYNDSSVTEDWSNNAENSAITALNTGINDFLKYNKIENSYFKTIIIFHSITVFTAFVIKTVLVRIRDSCSLLVHVSTQFIN